MEKLPLYTFSRLGRYGKLGNQMFQIAAVMGIAARNNAEYAFPAWEFNESFTYALPKVHSKIPPAVIEQSFSYREYSSTVSVDWRGYFQSEKYFSHIAKQIKQVFAFRNDLVSRMQAQWEHVLSENPVKLLCRRADYLTEFKHIFVNLADDTNYYESASALFPGRKFLIFSDDIEYCRARFSDWPVAGFVTGLNTTEQLILQTLCRDHVNANSTFSWWGTWLGEKHDSKVICPDQWFAAQHCDSAMPFVESEYGYLSGWLDTSDLIPDRWNRI